MGMDRGGDGISGRVGAEKNVAWRVPVEGRGHRSPVIWGDHLLLTTSIKGEQVTAYSAPDDLGFDLKPGYLHADSVDVDYMHALRVMAYDARTGKVLWERSRTTARCTTTVTARTPTPRRRR